jgi:hypothetical protein
VSENRSFYSIDDGASYGHFEEIFDNQPSNALIRALVAIGDPEPTPTPTPVPTPTPTPNPVNVALTSGVPQDGYIDKFGPYTGYVPDTQYTIQVPNGATQLKIELDANTNLDFYVRYGSRVACPTAIPNTISKWSRMNSTKLSSSRPTAGQRCGQASIT